MFYSQKRKKLVIILGAGRCGSTYLLGELNKIQGVNIFGENYNLFSEITQAIYATRETIIKEKNGSEHRKRIVSGTEYTGFEWHNNSFKLRKILQYLENSISTYFNNKNILNGFKEIRFQQKKDIVSLQYFEEKYEVYYIHLTRDIHKQSRSGFWKKKYSQVAEKEILNMNNNIESVLGNKKQYLKVDLEEITNNIDVVINFLEIENQKFFKKNFFSKLIMLMK